MKHTYLYLEGSEYVVRISDTEKPEEPFNYPHNEKWEADFKNELKLWTEACHKYPVAKGEEEKFIGFARSIWADNELPGRFIENLNQGIKLSPENVEIKQMPETDERNTIYYATYAYFKESKAEEDLWPSDEKIRSLFPVYEFQNEESQSITFSERSGAIIFRDYLKQNFNLIPKEK